MQQNFASSLEDLVGAGADLSVKHQIADSENSIGQYDLVIAAITSCTIFQPSVIAAGLVAQKIIILV